MPLTDFQLMLLVLTAMSGLAVLGGLMAIALKQRPRPPHLSRSR